MKELSVTWPVRRRRWIATSLLLLSWLSLPLPAADEDSLLSTALTAVDPVMAPDFTLHDMDERPYTLSELRGSYVLLNFWATWCPPCRREMPSMEYLYQRFRGRSFRVLAVNQWEDPDHVFSYMGELDVYPSFPILFDRKSRISEQYGVRGLPASFLVDPDGRIVYRAIGGREFNHPDIVSLIDSLLDQAQ